MRTETLTNPWAGVIPGLYAAVVIDSATGEIVGYPASEPKPQAKGSSDATVASRPNNRSK